MIYDKVKKFIKNNELITPGMTVIAAVSGGADSICLLDVLYHIKNELQFMLECVHFNHNLRGSESDGDEEFVLSRCKSLGITVHTSSANVRELCGKESLEDAARRARYTYFKTLTDNKNAVVATAHTLNDNVETFFINLLRGSGTRGLQGIPVTRKGIIRPMLDVTRDEILEHLKTVGLDYKTDSSNFDTSYLRNFIRLDILPRLNERLEINPYRTVSRAISNLTADSAVLDAAAESLETNDVEKLKTLPDPLLWRIFTKKLEKEYNIILDSKHFFAVKSLLCKGNSKEQIRGDIFAINEQGKLKFIRLPNSENFSVKLHIGENRVENRRILIDNVKEVYNHLTNRYIDCDKIGNDLYCGLCNDGDRFYPCKRNTTSHLKKLLKTDKVLPSKRASLLVIRDETGNVVFAQGYGADRRFVADNKSKKIICIEII